MVFSHARNAEARAQFERRASIQNAHPNPPWPSLGIEPYMHPDCVTYPIKFVTSNIKSSWEGILHRCSDTRECSSSSGLPTSRVQMQSQWGWKMSFLSWDYGIATKLCSICISFPLSGNGQGVTQPPAAYGVRRQHAVVTAI